MLDEPAAALYTGRALDGLRNAGCVGAFLWCFSDYVSDLATVPPFDAAPHELGFGPGGQTAPPRRRSPR